MSHHPKSHQAKLPTSIYIVFGLTVISNAIVMYIMLNYFL
jgi:hypothetical protein